MEQLKQRHHEYDRLQSVWIVGQEKIREIWKGKPEARLQRLRTLLKVFELCLRDERATAVGRVAVREKQHRRWSLENECGPGALCNGGEGLQ